MRALLCTELGPVDRLVVAEVPSPAVRPGAVRVRVRAAALNFPDTLIIEGKYQVRPPLPFAPGGEMAGEVLEIGEGTMPFAVGDRVMGLTGHGACAEEVVVAARDLVLVPERMSDEEAAAFTMVYGTSYHALKQRARIQPGETLLVLGAGGGVGLAAVELGKVMGARVIAVASSTAKLEAARAKGADELIDYSQVEVKEAAKALTQGRGVDVVYDPVGGAFTESALRGMAWNGRHLVVGFAAGDIPKVPANLTLLKGCALVGVFWGAFTQAEPAASAENMAELLAWYERGLIRPHVSRVFALEDYREAFAELTERRAIGKVVLRIA